MEETKEMPVDPWVQKIPWKMAWQTTPASTLVWRIPGTEEPGGLQSIGPQTVRNDWSNWAGTQYFHSYSPPRDPRPETENWRERESWKQAALGYIVSSGLLLLLTRFSPVRPCATPERAAHQAPPSLGFSRQEHWSGLPFPFPMHESDKWKKSLSRVRLFEFRSRPQ